ncbi:hypothetical protein PVAND_012280 [Polypedilum vanderplanki]|uniref:Uncharacterized protein n=1 Tax=Polypedilum vanderplanki TaxID=319348 RepID=A0A9J6CLY9_POLVA|nr:hypothetical protein PVAND_012280 [Polypedilum vanderplanki]
MSEALKAFAKRWVVTIVMVPSIALVHIGWMKLQDNPALVRPDEKKAYPHLQIFHKLQSAHYFDSKIRTFTHSPD